MSFDASGPDSRPERHAGPAPAPRSACPRCGGRLGRLTSDDRATTDAGDAPLYCGCCGLVLPGSGRSR